MDRGRGTGIFSVPPLEEIKKAKNVSAEKGPSLFKSAASHLQTALGKELSSMTQHAQDSTGNSAAVQVQTAGKSGGRVPDAKEGRNAELIKTGGTEGGGTSLQNEANFKKGVAPHASTSRNHPHVGAQASTAAINATGSSNARNANIHGQAHYRTESSRTGLNQSKQRDVPANLARVETGAAATGGTQESDLAVSTAAESSSSASATTAATAGSPHAILTNPVQKNNPVMKHIRNVPWELGDITADFVLGRTTCALFLSLRYHSLHPDYIHTRLKQLGKQYELRVLLVLVDVTECQKPLSELAKIALLADLTLVLAWSYEEAGRYLETYKAYENKPPDLLMERVDSDSSSRVTDCLTTVKKVNKTDAATLLNTFKTMDRVITASREELTLCPGLGPQKAQRLYDLFHEPFIPSKKPKLEL